MGAAGDNADALPFRRHRRAVTGDVARLHLQSDELAPQSVRLDLLECATAHEVALAELHRPAQPRFIRIDRLVHVVAPQSQCGFESGRVARSEPGRQHAGGLAVLEDRVPCIADAVARDEQLEAVLAGVARARDESADAGNVSLPEAEAWDRVKPLAWQELL